MKIKLPTGKEAIVIEVMDLNQMSPAFFSAFDLSKTERYVCIYYKHPKVFAMAVKSELIKKEVIAELKQDLEFQIAVLKQL